MRKDRLSTLKRSLEAMRDRDIKKLSGDLNGIESGQVYLVIRGQKCVARTTKPANVSPRKVFAFDSAEDARNYCIKAVLRITAR